MVHNGVVWNDFQVAEKQLKDGIRYASFQPNGDYNDSEVLMYDIASYIEGEVDHLTSEGSIAFIMVQRNKKGEQVALYFGRNSGSPLKMEVSKRGFALTSEGSAPDIKTNTLYRFDYKTGDLTETPLIMSYYDLYAKQPTANYGMGQNYTGYGDYRGYDDGYDWREHGTHLVGTGGMPDDHREISDEALELSRYNETYYRSNGSMTETTLSRYANIGRYGLTEETLLSTEANIIQEVITALDYDVYQGSTVEAMDFGEMLLEELQSKYLILENTMQQDGDLIDDDLDNYIELDNKIGYLTKALNTLKDKQLRLALTVGLRSVQKEQAPNVRYTPDH